jgi:uncharacterized membrane protein
MIKQIQEPDTSAQQRSRARVIRWAAAGVSLGITAVFLLRPPWTLVGKAHLVGYAVCHQLPSHSFHLGGRQLPLCARCTGIYLGAFFTFFGLAGRHRDRSGEMPPVPVLALLLGFVALMALDGVNSYVASFFPFLPHPYEPRNWLRLTTGLPTGVAMAVIITPIFHATVWRSPGKRPVLSGFRGLLPFLLLSLVLIPVVSAEPAVLFFPLALASIVGVLMLLSATNGVLAAMVLGLENQADGWREAAMPLLVGMGMAFLEIGAMDMFRAWLTGVLGLPF